MNKTINNKDFFTTIKTSLNSGEHVSFFVKGTSMLPFFKDGKTEVFLTKKDQYKKRDVCLFQYNEIYVLHRLVKIKDKHQYIFQGDHTYQFEVIEKEKIIGYVYQYKDGDKVSRMSSLCIQLKTILYLGFKKMKFWLRKVIKGV
jgi:signal peptidase I